MTRRAAAALGAGGAAALAYAGSDRLPAAVRARWSRRNHAGREVTLLEGPAHVVGLGVGGLLAQPMSGWAPAVAAVGAGALGALDDLVGDTASKGLRGHLAAARQGRVTTGAVKVLGLAVLGLGVASAQDRHGRRRPSPVGRGHRLEAPAEHPPRHANPRPEGRLQALIDALLGGAVLAGTANLVNLLDLRPGRALKAGVLLSVPLVVAGGAGSPAAAAALGAAAGTLAPDLRGEAMLGDTGANALGAVLGAALIDGSPRRRRVLVLSGLLALTLLSEKVSFTRIIESTPVLRELDAWGRPPR